MCAYIDMFFRTQLSVSFFKSGNKNKLHWDVYLTLHVIHPVKHIKLLQMFCFLAFCLNLFILSLPLKS